VSDDNYNNGRALSDCNHAILLEYVKSIVTRNIKSGFKSSNASTRVLISQCKQAQRKHINRLEGKTPRVVFKMKNEFLICSTCDFSSGIPWSEKEKDEKDR
jgi:hypothetical protein